MKRLSRYRRHRAAAPTLLVFALLAIGTTFSVASATPNKSALALARSAVIEEGKQLFLKGCSSCHGLNAEGGAIAPSLIGVGAASVDFQVATGRMPMADMSTQAMRKEPVYTPEQVAALAAYVASLAPGPEIPGDELLNYERDGSLAEGGELFRNNCAMCHNFAGQGGALTQGKYAPSNFAKDALLPDSILRWKGKEAPVVNYLDNNKGSVGFTSKFTDPNKSNFIGISGTPWQNQFVYPSLTAVGARLMKPASTTFSSAINNFQAHRISFKIL